MANYVSPFTGDVIVPTDVSYLSLNITVNTALIWPAYRPAVGTYVVLARIIDITSSAPNLQLALPQGNQGALGSDTLITNRGANTILVTDFAGGNSVSIAAGRATWFYLADNTTAAGIWRNVDFGVGTSSADAASLAGNGLTTSAGRLATTTNLVQFNLGSLVLSDSSRATAFIWTGGVGTLPLPLAASLTSGWFFILKNNGTGALTVQPTGGALIDGKQNTSFLPGQSSMIALDIGTLNFFTLNTAASAAFSFSTQTFDVDNISGTTLSLVANSPIIQRYVALAGTRTTSLAVTLPATTSLYVVINSTNASGYQLTFQLSGSSQPPIAIASGQQFFMTSDSNFLYVLNQTAIGVFSAQDGAALTPSFSFLNETSTGFYRPQGYRLATSIGGFPTAFVDGSDPQNPFLSINGTLVCRRIDGGRI